MYNGILPNRRQMTAIGDSQLPPLWTSRNQQITWFHVVMFNRSVVKLLLLFNCIKVEQNHWRATDENGISFLKLGKFHNMRWPAWRHKTLMKILRFLPTIQMQLAKTDDNLKHNLHSAFSVFYGQRACHFFFLFWSFHTEMQDLHSFGKITISTILQK